MGTSTLSSNPTATVRNLVLRVQKPALPMDVGYRHGVRGDAGGRAPRRAFNTLALEEVTRPGELRHCILQHVLGRRCFRTKGCGCRCGGGVLFTPDLFITNGVSRIGEIKLNSMSRKKVFLGSSVKLTTVWTRSSTNFFVSSKFTAITLARVMEDSTRSQCGRWFTSMSRIFSGAGNIEFEQWELEEEWGLLLRHGISTAS